MIQYSQRDPRWASNRLGFGESDITIRNYGCLLATMATVLTKFGFTVNPQELNDKLCKINGFTSGMMYYNSISQLYPVDMQLFDFSNSGYAGRAIDEALAAGKMVIVEIDSSPRQGFQNHWVLVYAKENGDHLISDPWSLEPEKEKVFLETKYCKNINLGVRSMLTVSPRVSMKPLKQEVPNTDCIVTIVDALRLRNNPSLTNSFEITKLPKGTVLKKEGDVIRDGAVVWQPVILYVAASYDNEKYIE